jgi:phage terminase large subunit-like protein
MQAQQKRLAAQARDAIVAQNRFFDTPALPPTPCNSLSLANQDELAATDSDGDGNWMIGREQPRLVTAGLGGISFGPFIAEWAERVQGVTLMPWQRVALDGQFETVALADGSPDPFGFVFRESLVSTARQQGKSVALTAAIGWWITEFAILRGQPQHVLSVANRLDRAEGLFTVLAPILVEKFGGKQLAAIGRKSVTMPDGSTWEIRAASSRLHGGSYDAIFADEIFDIDPDVIDTALRPSQIARRSPLLSMWSTAGDESSTAMQQIRSMCIADMDAGVRGSTFMAEWSLSPGMDPKNERNWKWANPALGTTVTIEALRAVSKKESFLRAHLNMWVAARGAWLEPGVWDGLQTTEPMPAGGVLSVESSLDEARFVGVRAATDGAKTHVHVEFVVDSETEMWDEVARVLVDQRVQLAVTPTLEIHVPPQFQRRMCVVGYGELVKFTPLMKTMVLEGRVTHHGHLLLAEQVQRAVIVRTAGGNIVLSSQKSPGPIELARAMCWCVALASKPQTNTKPFMVIAK